MSKVYGRESTDPFQAGSKGARGSGVLGLFRKKRVILFVLAVLGVVWIYATRGERLAWFRLSIWSLVDGYNTTTRF